MNNLELFNKFWRELEKYKNDKVALGCFADLLVKNKPELAKDRIIRFLQKIDYVDVLDTSGQIGTKVGTCWEWTAGKFNSGYGAFNSKRSHRFMLFLIDPNFDLDSELLACHSCDNPSCNNPNHIWHGTAQDNNIDKINKGRAIYSTGINQGNAKLTDDQVWAIFYDPRVNDIIAAEYSVSIYTISVIKTGKRKLTDPTKSLPKNQNIRSLQGKTGHNSGKVTKDHMDEILKLYATGKYLQKDLAIKFGVSQDTISSVINGKNLKRFGIQQSPSLNNNLDLNDILNL
jgi:hypothetical protein